MGAADSSVIAGNVGAEQRGEHGGVDAGADETAVPSDREEEAGVCGGRRGER